MALKVRTSRPLSRVPRPLTVISLALLPSADLLQDHHQSHESVDHPTLPPDLCPEMVSDNVLHASSHRAVLPGSLSGCFDLAVLAYCLCLGQICTGHVHQPRRRLACEHRLFDCYRFHHPRPSDVSNPPVAHPFRTKDGSHGGVFTRFGVSRPSLPSSSLYYLADSLSPRTTVTSIMRLPTFRASTIVMDITCMRPAKFEASQSRHHR